MEQLFWYSTATMSTETEPNKTIKTKLGIYYVQRSGLAEVGEIEFRPPG
jgi:hypothetical protein